MRRNDRIYREMFIGRKGHDNMREEYSMLSYSVV